MEFMRTNDPYLQMDNWEQFTNLIPKENQCFRFMSKRYGFSLLSLILVIAEKSRIIEFYGTSYRIGKKEMNALEGLEIPKFYLTLGQLMKREDSKYGYYELLQEIATENNWHINFMDNHSKVFLLKLESGESLVIETSANLNQNSKIEQYLISNDAEAFNYYVDVMTELEVWK